VAIEEKVPVNGTENEQPMETEQKEETKNAPVTETEGKKEEKIKTTSIQMLVDPQWIRGKLPHDEMLLYKDLESNLILADKNWKERIDARNELEEYVYEWRGKMEEGRYDVYVEGAVKESFLVDLNEMQQWLYADEETGETQSKSVYSEKINSLKSTYSKDILYREYELNHRDQYLERLGKALQLGQKLLETEEKVDEKKFEKLQTEIQDKQKWFEESHSAFANTAVTVNPVITTKDILQQVDQLEQASKAIMDELQRKRQERQREEEKRKKEEEDKKKAEAQAAAAEQAPAGDTLSTQPMDVDPTPAPPAAN
jgi:hypothetical protein